MLVDTKDRKVMGDEDDDVSPDMGQKKAPQEADLGMDLDLMNLGGPTPAPQQQPAGGDVMNLLDMLGSSPVPQQ